MSSFGNWVSLPYDRVTTCSRVVGEDLSKNKSLSEFLEHILQVANEAREKMTMLKDRRTLLAHSS